MRAAQWFGGIALSLMLAAPLAAQQASGFQGSFSGQNTHNTPLKIDASNFSTPIPSLPTPKTPFSWRSLVPKWMLPKPKPAMQMQKLNNARGTASR